MTDLGVTHDDNVELFYIQDTRTYVGNSVMWWCPNDKGYTTHVDQAGKYTLAEALDRCTTGTHVAWRCSDVDAIWSQHVDVQHLRKIVRVKNTADKR